MHGQAVDARAYQRTTDKQFVNLFIYLFIFIYLSIYAGALKIDSKNTTITQRENALVSEEVNVSNFDGFDDLSLK